MSGRRPGIHCAGTGHVRRLLLIAGIRLPAPLARMVSLLSFRMIVPAPACRAHDRYVRGALAERRLQRRGARSGDIMKSVYLRRWLGTPPETHAPQPVLRAETFVPTRTSENSRGNHRPTQAGMGTLCRLQLQSIKSRPRARGIRRTHLLRKACVTSTLRHLRGRAQAAPPRCAR